MRTGPVFNPKTIADRMATFVWPDDLAARHRVAVEWAQRIRTREVREAKEVALHGDFLEKFFKRILGYQGMMDVTGDRWTLLPEATTSSGRGSADAALGFFHRDRSKNRVVVPIELKGVKTDLDRPQSTGRTPVQQGYDYMNDTPDCSWLIVSNYDEIRLYSKRKTTSDYELFRVTDLEDFETFKRFYFLFCPENVLPERSVLDQLLEASRYREEQITKGFYAKYKQIRVDLLNHLEVNNPERDRDSLVRLTQKILDRILFACFCEDSGLLPLNTVASAYESSGFVSKWQNFLGLFSSIDKGNPPMQIPGYNGGLFASDPELNSLVVTDDGCAIFYQLASVDYSTDVSVNILGHIFEQSLDDLAALKANGTATESKRKSDGIFYTPPEITKYIVEQTVGTLVQEKYDELFARLRPDQAKPSKAAKKRQTVAEAQRLAWRDFWEQYREALKTIRVVDPACGSGAFLVAAFDYLAAAYKRCNEQLALLTRDADPLALQPSLFDPNRTILTENLFGVDLNPESVEITKLSLWLKTAERGKQLTALDDNIKCGNSIISDPAVELRAFNWQTGFPQVFAQGGFDAVIGNPPYVKLQNFRKTRPAEASWLVSHYDSAKTGNFDLYLPFIERGLSLLHPKGIMGYIAPSLWVLNEYGKGLRRLVSCQKALWRFVDFKSYQVFPDATIYTALQFFRRQSCEGISYAACPDGSLPAVEWSFNSYSGLTEEPWILLSASEQEIMGKLMSTGKSLGDSVQKIIVGIQTSADSIYHLQKLSPGRYLTSQGVAVELEDEILRSLVTGKCVGRYAEPQTAIYLLFPYDLSGKKPRLWTQMEMERQFPKAWSYLKSVEAVLRRREKGKMDHEDSWWAYNYPKNLDLQESPKILVGRLLRYLQATADPNGEFFLDNVDVGGIIPKKPSDLYYLLAVLNSPVANFVWRRISKPFRGDYRSANKQFIAPLPIPEATGEQQTEIGRQAEELARLYTDLFTVKQQAVDRIVTDLLPANTTVSQKLKDWWKLSNKELWDEIAARRKTPVPALIREDWEQNYLPAKRKRLEELAREILAAEAEINRHIYSLYKLTDAEISLIEADKKALNLA